MNSVEIVPELELEGELEPTDGIDKIHSILPDQPPLLHREFVDVEPRKEVEERDVIRVMQWNCLAQALSTGADNFIHCPPAALEWKTRRLRILEEIIRINPDILCMQEVDHFSFLDTTLGSFGYRGLFFPKPDSPALYAKDSNGPDGCALFCKRNKVQVLSEESIVLKDVNGWNTNQVCVICTFKWLPQNADQGFEFAVATTHLKAKRGWDQLRYEQGSDLLKHLRERFYSKPVIVCGDFNAEETEPVYKAFRECPLNLRSAYTLMSESKKAEPPYTTWKIRGGGEKDLDVCRTIDYIWYSKEKLKVKALLSIPSGEDIGPGRLPSFTYPSDHFSLAADLYFKCKL